MNLVQVLIESFRSMAANRLRTALTMLGIVIGIASVVLLLALGDSMQRFIGKQLQMLGTNMVYVMPGGDRTAAQRAREGKVAVLTQGDAEALNALPTVRHLELTGIPAPTPRPLERDTAAARVPSTRPRGWPSF